MMNKMVRTRIDTNIHRIVKIEALKIHNIRTHTKTYIRTIIATAENGTQFELTLYAEKRHHLNIKRINKKYG